MAQAQQVIPYTPALRIANISALAKGTGARYLEVIQGEGSVLVAKQWRRVLPASGMVVDMDATQEARG